MSINKVDHRKLKVLQVLANACNDELITDVNYGKDIEERGGFVLLRDHYAASPKLFFGINPGEDRYREGEPSFFVGTIEINGPWEVNKNTGESVQPEFVYWQNCSKFFYSDAYLYRWISDATSAFLVPWVFKNVEDLQRHYLWPDMKAYSKQIARMIIRHHEPRVVIVAGSGQKRRDFLTEFLNIPRDSYEPVMTLEQSKREYGKSWNNLCQWGILRNWQAPIYMVPHFSRFYCSEARENCASWLSEEIRQQWGREINNGLTA